MKQITTTLILLGAFSWSNATAQTQGQQHKHEQHEEVKQAPPDKGVASKGEMKQKMKEKMKDMECCPKEKQKQPKSEYHCSFWSAPQIVSAFWMPRLSGTISE